MDKQIIIGGGNLVNIWIDHDTLNIEEYQKKFFYEIDINKTTFYIQTDLETEMFQSRLKLDINFKLDDKDVALLSDHFNKQFIRSLTKNEQILEFIPDDFVLTRVHWSYGLLAWINLVIIVGYLYYFRQIINPTRIGLVILCLLISILSLHIIVVTNQFVASKKFLDKRDKIPFKLKSSDETLNADMIHEKVDYLVSQILIILFIAPALLIIITNWMSIQYLIIFIILWAIFPILSILRSRKNLKLAAANENIYLPNSGEFKLL